MTAFTTQHKVMFQHCDPAGIVFYPRYFEMINACVEQWFSDALGYSFAKMHLEEKVGVPTVNIQAEFVAPSFLEDQLDFALSVSEIGAKSLQLSIKVNCLNQRRLEAQVTLVFVDLTQEKPKSITWRTDLKQLFAKYGEEYTEF